MLDYQDPTTWADEDLDMLVRTNALALVKSLAPDRAAVAEREIARRAEIRLNRRMDVEYGSNRYDFTVDQINEKHDASWYASRQTEEEALSEF